MYIPGRLRTASSPSRTWISSASYSGAMAPLAGSGGNRSLVGVGAFSVGFCSAFSAIENRSWRKGLGLQKRTPFGIWHGAADKVFDKAWATPPTRQNVLQVLSRKRLSLLRFGRKKGRQSCRTKERENRPF